MPEKPEDLQRNGYRIVAECCEGEAGESYVIRNINGDTIGCIRPDCPSEGDGYTGMSPFYPAQAVEDPDPAFIVDVLIDALVARSEGQTDPHILKNKEAVRRMERLGGDDQAAHEAEVAPFRAMVASATNGGQMKIGPSIEYAINAYADRIADFHAEISNQRRTTEAWRDAGDISADHAEAVIRYYDVILAALSAMPEAACGHNTAAGDAYPSVPEPTPNHLIDPAVPFEHFPIKKA